MIENYTKSELKSYFSEDNSSGYKTRKSHIEKKFPDLINKIDTFISNSEYSSDISFTQKLYNYINDIEKRVRCENCGKEIKWKNKFSEGYTINCGRKCMGENKNRLNRIKKTTKERYGVDHISKSKKIKKLKEKISIKKYGKKSFFQTEEFKELNKKIIKEKYGVKYAQQSKEIQEKTKRNNLKKYGVTNPSKLESVKEKLKNTNLEKYGVEHVLQSTEILNRVIEKRTKENNEEYKKILGNNVEIFNEDSGNIRVANQCLIHNEYIINRTLFYYRVLKYGIENPCIHCNPINRYSSTKENEIKDFIENELGITTEKIRIDNKEVDIFIESKNIGIEFNGLYWHSEVNKSNTYHLNKTKFFNEKNVDIIHIFEDEWVNKKNVVKSLLSYKLGVIKHKIYARKCEIKEITYNETKKFLQENHLQGTVNSPINIGLFYDNQMVSLMTFGKPRRKKEDDGVYELFRFANKIDHTIIGGASKLFKYFINNYQPKKIVTFADRRYSNGILYDMLGFIKVKITPPNYWYFNKHELIRHHRFNFRKKVLVKKGYDSSKTEKQIMQERGYYRIYDCGNIKYEITF